MPIFSFWLKKFINYSVFFIFTFLLVYMAVNPAFTGNFDFMIAFKTSLGTSAVFLLILLARKLTSQKNKKEIDHFRKGASLWTQLTSQAILYLMVVFTVYSFIVNIGKK